MFKEFGYLIFTFGKATRRPQQRPRGRDALGIITGQALD
jgi:hypothetical protein